MEEPLQIKFRINKKDLVAGAVESARAVSDAYSNEISERMENLFKKITQDGQRVMQLGGIFSDFFKEFSEASGDSDKISDAMNRLEQKSDFLRKIETKSGINGLLNELNIKNLDKLLKKQDEILQKEQQRKDIIAKENKLIIQNNAASKARDIDTLKSIGNKSDKREKILETVKGYTSERIAQDSKYAPKDQSAQLEMLDAARKYADLIASYQKVSQEKHDNGTEEMVTQQIEIISILKELKDIETKNPVLSGFRNAITNDFNNIFGKSDTTKDFAKKFTKDLKDAFEDGFEQRKGNFVLNQISNEASTVETRGLTNTVDAVVKKLTDKLEKDIADIYDEMIYMATGMAAKKAESVHDRYMEVGRTFLMQEENAPQSKKRTKISLGSFGKKKSDEKIEQAVDGVMRYYQSIEKAKENIERLLNDSDVKEVAVTEKNFEKIKDLVGYIQGYISLGGNINDLKLDATTRKRFEGNGMRMTYSQQVTSLKETIIDAFKEVTVQQNAENYGSAGNAQRVGATTAEAVTKNPNVPIGAGISNEDISKITGLLEGIKTEIINLPHDNEKTTENINKIIDAIDEVDKGLSSICEDLAPIAQKLVDIGDKIDSLLPQISISAANSIGKDYVDMANIILDQLHADEIMKGHNGLYEHGWFATSNGLLTTPFLHGDKSGVNTSLVYDDAKRIAVRSGEKIKYGYHSHSGDKRAAMSFPRIENGEYKKGDLASFLQDNDYDSKFFDIEEQLIGGIESVQVVFTKKFFEAFRDKIEKADYESERKNSKGEIEKVKEDFYKKFARDLEEITQNKKSSVYKKIVFNAHESLGGIFNISLLESTHNDLYNKLKDQIPTYTEDFLKQITDENNNKKDISEQYDDFINKIVKDNNLSDIEEERLFSVLKLKFGQVTQQDIYNHLNNYVLENSFGINDFLGNYTHTYNLKKTSDKNEFLEKYGFSTATLSDVVDSLNAIKEEISGIMESFNNTRNIDGLDNINNELDELKNRTNETKQDIDSLKEKVIELSEAFNELQSDNIILTSSFSPTQEFDNEIQQNLVMLENYENTLKEIDKLKIEPETEETKAKIEELNKLADYFASKITAIRSENGHEINKSMMYFNGHPNEYLQNHYDYKDIKRFDKVAEDRLGLNIDKVSTEFYGIEQEIKNIESQSESLRHSLNEALSDSRDYVKNLSAKLLDLVDSTIELKTLTEQRDIDDQTKWIDHILEKYPELEKFKDKFMSYGAAKDFVKSDEWNDFLATLPKAHVYLEELGYDFDRINKQSNTQNGLGTEEFQEQLPDRLSPTLIKVKPILNPNEFVDEITDNIKDEFAKVNVKPNVDDPNLFVTETTQFLNGWNATISVQPEINEPSKFAESVSEQIQFSPAQIPVEPLSEGEFDSEGFSQKVTNRLIGETVKIDTDFNINNQDRIDGEISKVNELNDALKETSKRIGKKNTAFTNEEKIVNRVVASEKDKLTELKESVENVTSAVREKTDEFKKESNAIKNPSNSNVLGTRKETKKEETNNEQKYNWEKMYKDADLENYLFDKKKNEENYREIYTRPLDKFQRDFDRVSKSKNSLKYLNEYNDVLNDIQNKLVLLQDYKLDITNENQVQEVTALENEITDLFGKLSEIPKRANSVRAASIIQQMQEYVNYNTRIGKGKRNEIIALMTEAQNPEISDIKLQEIQKAFFNIQTEIDRANKAGSGFIRTLKNKVFYTFAQQIASYFSFRDIMRYAKMIGQNVIQLNTQFTELAKVSDHSIKELEKDFKSYADTAKEVGGTITDTIAATADWARMGYNLPDSKELARVALIYKNVGDGIDISTANESLISTLQGFQMEAKDAIHIIDVFNEVSNNFAISSGGIGEALKRSAASFNAANTDLQKSVALVTTTNTVLQDPQVVGNLWKTMSARIRGSKTELEELNEEQDEYTESTSKLRGLVKSLTGFDIMKDNNTYKDLYEIMVGIGKEWQNLTDIERASLGEALAGKRMANGLYAVLNNIDTLEKAYQTAEDAEGSAMREQERYQQSIQYSIDKTKASIEELSQTLVSSDLIKFFVEAGNAVINFVNNITKLGGLGGTLSAGIGAFLGFKNVGIFNNGFTNGIGKLFEKADVNTLKTYADGLSKIDDIEQRKIYTDQFLLTNQKNMNSATRDAIVNSKNLSSNIDQYADKSKAATIATSALNVALNAAIGIGISLAIRGLTELIDILIKTDEELAESVENTISKYKEAIDEANSYKETIEGLIPKYEELSKGVDSLGRNISLTEDEFSQYNKVVNQIADMFPTMVDGWTSEGNAIINLKDGVEELRQAYLDAQEAAYTLLVTTGQDTSGNDIVEQLNRMSEKSYVVGRQKVLSKLDEAELLKEFLEMSNPDDFDKIFDNAKYKYKDPQSGRLINFAQTYLASETGFGKEYVDGDFVYTEANLIKAQLAAKNLYRQLNQETQQNLTKYRSLANAWMHLDENYKELDSSVQNAVSRIINGIDIETALQHKTSDDVGNYVADILDKIANDKNAQIDLVQLIRLEDKDLAIKELVPQVDALITSLSEALGIDENTIRIALGFDTDSLMSNYYAIMNKAASASNGFIEKYESGTGYTKTIGSEWLNQYENFVKENSVNTQDELVLLLNLIEEYGNLEDAFLHYAKIVNTTKYNGKFTESQANAINDYQSSLSSIEEYLTKIRDNTLTNEDKLKIKTEFDVDITSDNAGDLQQVVDELFDKVKVTIGLDEDNEEILLYQQYNDILEQIKKDGLSDELQKQFDDTFSLIIEHAKEGKITTDQWFNIQKEKVGILQVLKEIEVTAKRAGKELKDAFSDIKNSTSVLREFEEAMKNNQISESVLSSVAGLSDELNTLVVGYYSGVTSVEEIYTALQEYRKKDFEQYRDAYIEKVKLDEDYYTTKIKNNDAFIKKINELYKFDLSKYHTYEEAKLNMFKDRLMQQFGMTKEEAIKELEIVAQYYDIYSEQSVKDKWGNDKLEQLNAGAMSGNEYANIVAYKVNPIVKTIEEMKKVGLDLDTFDLNYDKLADADSTKNDYEELFDFFERRIEVIDQALNKLDASLENVNGSMSKNILIAGKIGIVSEEIKDYSSALIMYEDQANKELAKLDADLQDKIKNGAVDLTKLMGEGGEEVNKILTEYQNWANKVNDCNQKLLELKETLRDLALDKFNNIVQDFTDEFELIGSASSFIDKQISLFEEAGQIIGKGFYEAQIEVSRKQRNLLEKEKAELINDLSSSIANGYIQKGTDEWLEMVNSIKEVDESILDCDQSIEQLQNSILELSDQAFERLQNQFSSLKDQLNNINSLIDEIDVSDEEGVWSKEGMTRLGMFAEQYELARHNVEKYQEQIDQLNDSYANGLYSTTEYLDKLSELTEQQWSEALAAEDAKKSIMDLNKARVDLIKEGIQKQIDKYKELIDAQKEALDQDKDLHDWQKTLAEKNKNITKLQNQIAVLSNDDSASANAKRIKLQQELNEALEDLEETQYDHSIEKQKEALDQQMEDFEDERQKEIDALEEYLKDTEKVQKDSFEIIKNNTNAIAETIAELVKTHGVIVSETITNSWKQGENAIAAYGETLAVESSGFMSEINILELYLGGLQAEADITAAEVANIFTAKADSLVMELNSTRDTEMDLINATNMLQNALIKTLEGGYDNSRIINSLREIQDEINKTIATASGAGGDGDKGSTPGGQPPKKDEDTSDLDAWKAELHKKTEAMNVLREVQDLGNQVVDIISNGFTSTSNTDAVTKAQQARRAEEQAAQTAGIPDYATNGQNARNAAEQAAALKQQQQNKQNKQKELDKLDSDFMYGGYWNPSTGQYSSAYEQLTKSVQYSQGAAETKSIVDKAIADYKARQAAILQKYSGYAVGVHKLKADEMAWTQELGQEAILSPTRNAILTKLNKGDTVLTAEQTDNLFKLSKIDPSTIFGKLKMPTYSSKTMTPVLTIGNVLTVNGNIDDTNVDKMKGFVNNAITKAFKDFSSEIIKR